jgi:type II secretory pathway component PulF
MLEDELADFMTYRKRPNAWLMWLRLMCHGIAWGLLVALLAFGVPRFEAVFSDFGVPLPEVTIRVIQASHITSVLIALILLLLVADGFVLADFDRRGVIEGSRRWSTVMIMTPLVLVAVTMVGVILPCLNVMQKLSG